MVNTILQGDALTVLKTLPDNYALTCVTSPPYFNLRDYGVEGQIGLEETSEEYLAKLVAVFMEVYRVLRPDGTLWLNIGDCYTGSGKGGNDQKRSLNRSPVYEKDGITELPAKNLMMLPHRLAIALQHEGWIVRQDNVWNKVNGMPESVLDRPTRSHEYIFLLVKQQKYYYDADAIRTPLKPKTFTTFGTKYHAQGNDALGLVKSDNWGSSLEERKPRLDANGEIAGSNMRSVWDIASESFPGAHFAVMPSKLVERCILAGSSPKACSQCGTPWRRITEHQPMQIRNGPKSGGYGSRTTDSLSGTMVAPATHKTLGWESTCRCQREPAHVPGNSPTKTDSTGWKSTRRTSTTYESDCTCDDQTIGKCIILDPFMGSGTTALVALQHNRNYLGIELNPEYIAMANSRIAIVQPTLWTDIT